MSKAIRVFIILLAAEGMILIYSWASAMGATASKQANNSPQAMSNQMVFTGVIHAINGSQWTINDQVYAIDPSVIQYGALTVGSPVKVQAEVAQDGSITVTSLGPPDSAMSGFSAPSSGMVNRSMPSIINNSVTAMATPKSSDQNEQYENMVMGTITSMGANGITVDGKVYALTPDSEIKSGLTVGDKVKLEFYAMPDGTFSIEEIRSAQYMSNNNGNYNGNDNEDYHGNYNGNYNSNSNNNYCSDDDEQDDHWSNSNSNSSAPPCHESDGDD